MLPKNWNDITIEQYVAVYKTLSEEPKTAEAQLDLLIKRTAYLTNLEPDYIEDNLTINDLAKMQDFLKSDLPSKLVTDFRFNGKRYKVFIDPTKYKAGDYMAVMNTVKDNKIDNLHKTIYCVCKEVDWKGRIIEVPENEIAERIESFKQLPLSVANPIAVFFCSLSENLTDVILKYSMDQMEKAKKALQTEIDCLNDSVG